MCGDYDAKLTSDTVRTDTPPRVRGLLTDTHLHLRHHRYNPACAGTTLSSSGPGRLLAIQPRVCGDYRCARSSSSPACDTTPRVRGLQIGIIINIIKLRYNPACAGTTSRVHGVGGVIEIQPRVCGDYALYPALEIIIRDTTPRVRGLRRDLRGLHVIFRYNPACAGTTHHTRKSGISTSIQPRVCGDYAHSRKSCRLYRDTTPRVRGLRLRRRLADQGRRYNPACAGTTIRNPLPSSAVSIQPRVCGDYRPLLRSTVPV